MYVFLCALFYGLFRRTGPTMVGLAEGEIQTREIVLGEYRENGKF